MYNMYMLNGVFLFATILIAFLVALCVVMAHNVGRRVKISFSLTLFSLTMWHINIFVADHVHSNLLLWNHLVFLWPTIGMVSFFAMVTILRRSADSGVGAEVLKKRGYAHRLIGVAIIISTIAQLAATMSGQIFNKVYLDHVSGTYVFYRGPAYKIYIVSIVVLLALIMFSLLTSIFACPKGSRNRQILETILVTVALAGVVGVLTNIIVPLVTHGQRYINYGFITVDILAIGFAFNIVRHKFLDVRVYVLRGVAYVCTLVVLALLYVVVAGLMSKYISKNPINTNTALMLSTITLAVAVMFGPFMKRFNKLTASLFYRDYYDPQEVLDAMSHVLVRTVDVDNIVKSTQSIIRTSVKTTFAKIILFDRGRDKQTRLDKLMRECTTKIVTPYDMENNRYDELLTLLNGEEVALAIKLRTRGEEIGYMLLGYRRSGAGFLAPERRFLALIADQLAVGLQNAVRFEEIQHFNETLQDKVNEATRKLRRSNDKLRTLDQTKDDFISMSSHQLRTPLTSVKGYVSMVLDGDAGAITPLQRKLLTQSFVSAQRMVYLISDLLNISRLRTGKFIIEAAPTNLAAVVKDEVGQLADTAKGRGLSLVVKMPDSFPTVLLDETKLRQVIMNFIDNAIYYTPSGGRIVVELIDTPKAIGLTVTDNGIGVPHAEQLHLFGKFYRADNARRLRPDGTGLGLYMAKKVIIAQGGSLIFKSQEGKGSVFGFTFSKEKLKNQHPIQVS